ncbi:MAG: nitroreductase family protein [Pseudomonadota bacterium]
MTEQLPAPSQPLAPRPEVLDFLLTRRSRPAKTLSDTAPARDALRAMLTAAGRSPDHGKLEPWRFVVAERAVMARVSSAAAEAATARDMPAETVEKTARAFTQGGVIVAVLAAAKPGTKIPDWEQALSAGAVCLALLNAALASGWGANWLTGPLADDETFLSDAFGARPGEYAAGFIHIGGETVVPMDRPRPDVEAITTWL